MKKLFPLFLAFGLVWGMSACDKVDCLYPDTNDCQEIVEPPPPPPPPEDVVVRKILLEEFTGVGCGRCPKFGELILEHLDEFSDYLIAVSLHGGHFSSGTGNTYDYELTSPEAEAYYTIFNVWTNPLGMVNRKSNSADPDDLLMVGDEWKAAIEKIIEETPEADVSLEIHPTYSAENRLLEVEVEVETVHEISGDYRLVVMVSEDYIIGLQTDYRGDPSPETEKDTKVEDYEHRHVHRSNVTDEWGEYVFRGEVEKGATETLALNPITLHEDWAENNCSIVAYLYNEATKEIIQVAETHLVE